MGGIKSYGSSKRERVGGGGKLDVEGEEEQDVIH